MRVVDRLDLAVACGRCRSRSSRCTPIISRRSSWTMSSALRSAAYSAIACCDLFGLHHCVRTSVETVFVDVARDTGRGRGTGSAGLRHPPADVGRGDADPRHPEELRPLAAAQAGERLVDRGARSPAPLGHREASPATGPARARATRQPRRDVAADDQEQLAIGRLCVQFLKGIDRVGRSRRARSRASRPRIAGHRCTARPAELQPVLGAGLARRPACGAASRQGSAARGPGQLDERLLGADQMTEVRRVERPAEDPDAQQAGGPSGQS